MEPEPVTSSECFGKSSISPNHGWHEIKQLFPGSSLLASDGFSHIYEVTFGRHQSEGELLGRWVRQHPVLVESGSEIKGTLEMTRTAFSCSLVLIILSSKGVVEFEEADCGISWWRSQGCWQHQQRHKQSDLASQWVFVELTLAEYGSSQQNKQHLIKCLYWSFYHVMWWCLEVWPSETIR